ncbi:MAG TPA: radical SAM protein [Polyangiaceae bacterium]|nr:radical SAM protein [Polyangiaceae bacterium]
MHSKVALGLLRGVGLALRWPAFQAFRHLGAPVLSPMAMSFVVTDRCNSRCQTCNIGARYLDDPRVAEGELSLAEYLSLARSLPELQWVTFSGGEPFMRKDFEQILGAVVRAAAPRVVTIPTNATLVERTTAGIRTILKGLGDTRLGVNLSCDGVGAVHDSVRGFEGNFEKLLHVHRELVALRDERLTIGVNSVLSRHNVSSSEELFDFVFEVLRPDSYVVEIAQQRPEYYNEGQDLRGETQALADGLQSFVARARRHRAPGIPRFVRAFRTQYYAAAARGLWQAPAHRCYAGFATCTVMPKGDVWSNTARADNMGNVRDFALDFPALWRGPRAQQVRKLVRGELCTCELSNTAYINSLLSWSTLPRLAANYALG